MSEYRNRIYGTYNSTFQGSRIANDDKASSDWGRAYDHYLRGWLPQSRSVAIVDLGCGSGRLLRFFAERGYEDVLGVDISSEQVELAKRSHENVMKRNVLEFVTGHSSSFDLIVALDLIEHFQKDEALRFLDATYGALRPQGQLILQTPNADSPWVSSVRYGDLTHENCFTPHLLRSLLTSAGFSSIEVRETGPIPFGYSFSSSARWVVWRLIRVLLGLWSAAETGSTGSGIHTRVFVASARKT